MHLQLPKRQQLEQAVLAPQQAVLAPARMHASTREVAAFARATGSPMQMIRCAPCMHPAARTGRHRSIVCCYLGHASHVLHAKPACRRALRDAAQLPPAWQWTMCKSCVDVRARSCIRSAKSRMEHKACKRCMLLCMQPA